MELAKQMVQKRDSRMKRIAENVVELKRAELMTALDLERGGTSGGFFSQVGTNLYTTANAAKLISSAKKSPKKVEQAQQTSPMSASKGVVSAKKKSPQLESAVDMFKRVSPKTLTPEQAASLVGRFRRAAINVQRGAGMLGLSDPPADSRAKRKRDPNTPGGPA